jgi:hypothetical protein
MSIPKPLSWLFLLLLTTSAQSAAETGLYDLLDSDHPKPFLELVGQTRIESCSNDNQHYFLALRAATTFSLPCTQIGLIVGNKTIHFESQGHGPVGYTSMQTTIDDPEVIPEIAKFFRADVKNRRHPGHRMLGQFIPRNKRFGPGEPVTITFRITNVGDADFTFWNGGRTRLATRNNQFAFTAELWGKVVPDTGNPEHAGGLSEPVSLLPGKSFEIESVDLKRWFRFDEKGSYKIRGSYYLRIGLPNENQWEDFACAEFRVDIE